MKDVSRKSITDELALAVRVSIACIENEILPSKKSPFHKKLKSLWLEWHKRKVKK